MFALAKNLLVVYCCRQTQAEQDVKVVDFTFCKLVDYYIGCHNIVENEVKVPKANCSAVLITSQLLAFVPSNDLEAGLDRAFCSCKILLFSSIHVP